MVKFLQYSIFSLLLLPAIVLEAAVTLELSRSTISMDETVDLILHHDDAGFTRNPEIPLPDGLQVRGTSRQETIVNFERESTIRYTLKASSPDTYTIGPFTLKTAQGEQVIPALTLTVTEAEVVKTSDGLFVTLTPSRSKVMVRETIELTLSFYSKNNVGQINILNFPSEGFDITEWQEFRQPNKIVDGERFQVRSFSARLTPTRSGTLELDPIFQVDVLDPSAPRGMFFQSRARSVRLKLEEPLLLDITSPPAEGRPDSFTGHLGNFRLSASASPTEVTAGDPITLRVELSGSGSLKQALPPGLKESGDFQVYKSRLVNEDFQRDGLSGRKIIEQVIIPTHSGVTEIPAVEFSFYDTSSRQYQTIRTDPIPLKVLEGAPGQDRAASISSLTRPLPEASPSMLGEDLIYLKLRPGNLRDLENLEPGWDFTGVSTLPFALWGLFSLVLNRREKRLGDLEGTRRQQAPRRLRKHLNRLDQSSEDLYATVWTLLSDYLGARLNLPAGELNPHEVMQHLPASVSDECREQLSGWMSRCERARFAGGKVEGSDENLRREFREFILNLDRELTA
ncbi:MAG: BatD family protein [Kiritimatiellia bacterium]